ncbi:hypothetical protein BJ138DRAFT_1123411 [Hygrophoropsis aurantiaca]|uniref:Uncharacterized protein n=1 Tax=Hygrophoropsis aurantiaca TaxID=72124 RepID=A0ACB8AMW9_9AGAM|nr:hypothetical protein BJ138DRAFT_1123411 [Hygrophoropsis aurantiaca]
MELSQLSPTDELRLRTHIRQLLSKYVKSHITTDYMRFTEDALEELFCQNFYAVPMADSTSIMLPPDPLDTLFRSLDSANLERYDERWAADANAVQLIKKIFIGKGQVRSDLCWREDDPYERYAALHRPMSPTLTSHSRRETSKRGLHLAKASMPNSQREMVDLTQLYPVDIEPIAELTCPKTEEMLNLKLKIDQVSHKSMVTLLKSILTLHPPSAHDHPNPTLDKFLRCDSPSPTLPRCYSPPLFARSQLPGYEGRLPAKNKAYSSIDLADLAATFPCTKHEDTDDIDITAEHLLLVDGWVAYAPISSPAMSSASTSSEIDEIFELSPDGTPATSLFAAKMEEIEIPRTRKFGTSEGHVPSLTDGKSLESFISPYVLSVATETPAPVSSPTQSLSDSLQGGPPTYLETTDGQSDRETDLHNALKSIYQVVGAGTTDIIMEEKLDEKDTMMMDVPDLLPPSDHPPDPMFRPSRLRDFVTSASPLESKSFPQFLTKVKGVKPLNIELSWVPVRYGSKIPTHEEVIKADGEFYVDFSKEYKNDIQDVEVLAMLEDVVSTRSIDASPLHMCREVGMTPPPEQHTLSRSTDEKVELVMTNAERRLLADLPKNATKPIGGSESVDPEADSDLRYLQMQERSPKHGRLMEFYPQQNIPPPFDNSRVGFARPIDANARWADDNDTFERSSNEFLDMELDVDFVASPRNYRNGSPDNFSPRFQGSDPVGETDASVDVCGPFLPLSFGSQSQQVSYPDPPGLVFKAHDAGLSKSLDDANDFLADNIPIGASDRSQGTKPLVNDTSASTRRSLANFLAMRKKCAADNTTLDELPSKAPPASSIPELPCPNSPRITPADLFDKHTLRLPDPWILPLSPHKYLGSLTFIQNRNLVSALRSEMCAIDLVERCDLDDADIILDPTAAIMFSPLLALSSQVESLVTKLELLSWRYSQILLIMQAFPPSHAVSNEQSETKRLAPCAYTPPLLKAVKKLRRNISISEGFGAKDPTCSISMAFANTVMEAAMFTRYFGDFVETNASTEVSLWGTRDWLDEDEQENEYDLARVKAMNAFAACVMLYQKPLQEILDQSSDERIREFGPLVGEDRVAQLSGAIEFSMRDIDIDIGSDQLEAGSKCDFGYGVSGYEEADMQDVY